MILKVKLYLLVRYYCPPDCSFLLGAERGGAGRGGAGRGGYAYQRVRNFPINSLKV